MLTTTNRYIIYYAQKYYYKKKRGIKMTDKAHLSMRLPKDLMKDLKIIAIQKEVTITSIVIELLQEYIDENKK
jgi:hypothetical protein